MSIVGPKLTPQEYLKENPIRGEWFHLIVNDVMETCKGYSPGRGLLWTVPCLARGLYDNWHIPSGDTPPGLYRVGRIYRDYELNGPNPRVCDRSLMSFGWYSFDLIDLEGQESINRRAGIMMHGGGSACGWPGAWQPNQTLYCTHGCIRLKNQDLKDKILPLADQGTVFVSVYQDA